MMMLIFGFWWNCFLSMQPRNAKAMEICTKEWLQEESKRAALGSISVRETWMMYLWNLFLSFLYIVISCWISNEAICIICYDYQLSSPLLIIFGFFFFFLFSPLLIPSGGWIVHGNTWFPCAQATLRCDNDGDLPMTTNKGASVTNLRLTHWDLRGHVK